MQESKSKKQGTKFDWRDYRLDSVNSVPYSVKGLVKS